MFNDSRMGSNKEAIEAKAQLKKARDVCSDFSEKEKKIEISNNINTFRANLGTF